MLKKAAALFFGLVGIAMWMACGKTTSHYVYAAISAANQVAAYREDPNSGALTALAGNPFTAGNGAHAIAVHPSRKFLYVANSGESDISLFTIASDGALTEVTPRTAAGTSPVLAAVDPAGSFLYIVSTGSNDLSVFSIDSGSGALTQVPNSPFSLGIFPISMTLSASGNILYIGGQGNPGLVEVFDVSSVSTGTVTPVTNSPFFTGSNPQSIAIDPTGTHLYTANDLDNSISEFTIGSDGGLTEISGSPIGESFTTPSSLLVDPSGKYLYVTNQGSNNIAAYAVGSDGSLTILTTSSFGTGTAPSFITADPNGKFLLVGNQSSPAIQVFRLNTGDGTLSSVSSYSVGGTPTSIVVTQ